MCLGKAQKLGVCGGMSLSQKKMDFLDGLRYIHIYVYNYSCA